MSNKKQITAVEWLINEHFGGIENCTPDFRFKIEQANQIFEEQIIEAHFEGCEIGEMFNNERRAFISDAKQYYQETYGTNENT